MITVLLAKCWHQVPLHLSTNQPCPDYSMENCHLGSQCIEENKKKPWQQKKKKNPSAVTKVTAPIPRSLPRAWHSAERSALKADKAHSRIQKPKRMRQRNVSSLPPGDRNRVGKVGHTPEVGRTGWKCTTGKRQTPESLGFGFVQRRLPSIVIFAFLLPLTAPRAEVALAEWRDTTWGEGMVQFDNQTSSQDKTQPKPKRWTLVQALRPCLPLCKKPLQENGLLRT